MEPDLRLTFDSFVVGPANRLAAAAARRTAEQPGRSYNPLFVYSASGLGKSHILSAVAHRARKQHPERVVIYESLEVYLGELTQALERGQRGALEKRYADSDLLLLDDVQFIAGQGQAQEMLLRTLDAITARGGQVVLASDRPPAEIDGLDDRLLSRFSGGLIVDMGRPDLETRVAIIRKKAANRNAFLAPGVSETLARFPFQNVRELEGALNRIIAVQELEERAVEASELSEMVRRLSRATGGDGGGSEEVAREEPRWKQDVRRAARAAEEEGFLARRLRRLLERDAPPEDWESSIRRFQADLSRAREIRLELDALGNPWPEAATTLLKDPDRLEEGEALLASARERARSFGRIPDGPSLDELEEFVPALALRAADRLLSADRPDYNPLFVHDEDGERARVFLEAVGRSYLRVNPKSRVGLISVQAFAEEFIRAISDGVAGAWRERWWTVEVLLLHGLEDLAETERAQDEFFHLFEALRRRDARIFLGSNRLPSEIENVDDRLRSRFEGGLVVELEGPELPGDLRSTTPAAEPAGEDTLAPTSSESDEHLPATEGEGWADPALAGVDEPAEVGAAHEGPVGAGEGEASGDAGASPDDDLLAVKELAGLGTQPRDRVPSDASSAGDDRRGHGRSTKGTDWVPSPERVVWNWPADEERLLEDF